MEPLPFEEEIIWPNFHCRFPSDWKNHFHFPPSFTTILLSLFQHCAFRCLYFFKTRLRSAKLMTSSLFLEFLEAGNNLNILRFSITFKEIIKTIRYNLLHRHVSEGQKSYCRILSDETFPEKNKAKLDTAKTEPSYSPSSPRKEGSSSGNQRTGNSKPDADAFWSIQVNPSERGNGNLFGLVGTKRNTPDGLARWNGVFELAEERQILKAFFILRSTKMYITCPIYFSQAVRDSGTLKSVVLDSELGSNIEEAQLRTKERFTASHSSPQPPASLSQFLSFDSGAKKLQVKMTDIF